MGYKLGYGANLPFPYTPVGSMRVQRVWLMVPMIATVGSPPRNKVRPTRFRGQMRSHQRIAPYPARACIASRIPHKVVFRNVAPIQEIVDRFPFPSRASECYPREHGGVHVYGQSKKLGNVRLFESHLFHGDRNDRALGDKVMMTALH